MKRGFLLAAIAAAAAVLAAGVGATAAAGYGGGAGHDTWQVGLSSNCNNPSSDSCLEFDQVSLGGFWGWVEFDGYANDSITGDGELTRCTHARHGGGPGSAGATHFHLDITQAHIGPSQPGDPNYPLGDVFYIDHNVVAVNIHGSKSTTVDDSGFLGDTNIPVEPGHYSLRPDPGVAVEIQVAFRAAR